MANVEVKGFREAARALRALAYSTPRAITPCIAKALEPIRDAMIAEIPVDTGNLASHVEIVSHAPRKRRASAEVRVSTPYAFHVDEGTEGHKADHFAEIAVEQQERRSLSILSREIARGLERG
jgi:HK97 gp10 family phage protein